MKKRQIVALFVVLAILATAFAGCKKTPVEEKPLEEGADSKKNEASQKEESPKVSYEEVEKENLDEKFAAVADSVKNNRSYIVSGENSEFLIISSGKKPTTGYSLKVEDIETIDKDTLKVIVEEIEPKEDAATGQAIDYPQVIIKIDTDISEYKQIEVVDKDGEPFTEAELMLVGDSDKISVATGSYVGLIDNNSFELKKDDEAMVFRIEKEELKENLDELDPKSGDSLSVSYKEEDGQNIVTEIIVES